MMVSGITLLQLSSRKYLVLEFESIKLNYEKKHVGKPLAEFFITSFQMGQNNQRVLESITNKIWYVICLFFTNFGTRRANYNLKRNAMVIFRRVHEHKVLFLTIKIIKRLTSKFIQCKKKLNLSQCLQYLCFPTPAKNV